MKKEKKKKQHRHKWSYGGECPKCHIFWEDCISGDCEAQKIDGKIEKP